MGALALVVSVGPLSARSVRPPELALQIRRVLEALLRIVGESPEYFVSGSLSFLPLVPPYREPRHDVDVGVSIDLFRQNRAKFEAAGHLHMLRLSEVAIADASPLTRILAPRTKFVHINTPDGLIDLSQYRLRDNHIELFLGAGLTLRVPVAIMERARILEWQGLSYRAGPPELAILPKELWYLDWKDSGAEPTAHESKHLADLRNATMLVDWEFSESLLAASEFYWLGFPFPRIADRALNPFRKLDIASLRHELEQLAA